MTRPRELHPPPEPAVSKGTVPAAGTLHAHIRGDSDVFTQLLYSRHVLARAEGPQICEAALEVMFAFLAPPFSAFLLGGICTRAIDFLVTIAHKNEKITTFQIQT